MRKLRFIFTLSALILAFLGILDIIPNNTALPLVIFFMGLVLLTNAKEYYDKGSKKDALIFVVGAIFVYAIMLFICLNQI